MIAITIPKVRTVRSYQIVSCSVAERTTTAHGLWRILGVGFGLAVIIGSTLGIGILRTPGLVAGELQLPATIIAMWVGGGVYTMLGAICLAELGTLAPQAGGYYVYARRAFGDWVGFAVGWSDWITYCAVLAYVSIGMSELVAELVPVPGGVRPLAIAILVGFVALQWIGLRVSSWFQEWTTALKCVAFLALIIAAFALAGDATGAAPTVLPSPLSLGGVVSALQAIVITYAGWQSGLYFAEEDRDPTRNLPRAMIGGVLAVIAIYVLVNVALLVVLPVADLAASKLPAADAAQRLVGGRGRDVITVLSIISLPPLLNAIMMIGTRILFALGRDRLVWPVTSDVNRGGTPGVATLATTAVAIVLIATGTFQRLIAIAAFFLAVNYAICCLALVVLRRREPDAVRPFRAWGYPWSAAIVVAGALAFVAGALVGDTMDALAALGLLVVGLLGYATIWRR
jgi:basic amino acid/polyamine antiporter, APA family